MIPRYSIRAVLGALVALGCGASEPTADTRQAALIQTCAPWDGPAVALFLTDQPPVGTYPAPPYASITVYRPVSQLAGQEFRVTASSSNLGIAQDCPSTGECAVVRGAQVSFGIMASDSTIPVSYRLELGSGRILRGQARPRLYPAPALCG